MIKKIRIISMGKIKERYIQEGIDEYKKRLQPFCRLEALELKGEGIPKEAEKLSRYVGDNTFILDSGGKQFSSEEFASFIKTREGELTFIIGGSEGVESSLKKKAQLISLSRMTFLHEMCRLFLIEQIYRAYMIIHNRVYHK